MNLFVVIEGLDCSGKTSICNVLKSKIDNLSIFRFPERDSETGKIIDRFLKKEIHLGPYETHLLFSANRYELSHKIVEAKSKGLVLCDRYWMSGAVYSAAKGIDYNWAKSTDKFIVKPDLTFFLDVNANETSKRSTFGREAHDKIEFQQKVYDIYMSKAKEENLILVDCTNKTPEQIATSILERIVAHANK